MFAAMYRGLFILMLTCAFGLCSPAERHRIREERGAQSDSSTTATPIPSDEPTFWYPWKLIAVAVAVYFSLCLVLFIITCFMLQRKQLNQKTESLKLLKEPPKTKETKGEQPSTDAAHKNKGSEVVVTLGSFIEPESEDKSIQKKITPDVKKDYKGTKSKSTSGTARERERKRKYERLFTKDEEETQEELTISLREDEADKVDTAHDVSKKGVLIVTARDSTDSSTSGSSSGTGSTTSSYTSSGSSSRSTGTTTSTSSGSSSSGSSASSDERSSSSLTHSSNSAASSSSGSGSRSGSSSSSSKSTSRPAS